MRSGRAVLASAGDMGHGEAEYGELRPLAGARPGGKELRSQRTRGDK